MHNIQKRLQELEAKSIYLIKEAVYHAKKPALLWSMGKDSNTLVWLIKKAFDGQVPFPVILLDTGEELDEVYQFRDQYIKEWQLNYINAECPSLDQVDQQLPPNAKAAARKTKGLEAVIRTHQFDTIFLGIRRDEQAIRAKERFVSPRSALNQWDPSAQPPEIGQQYHFNIPEGGHLRIHPLLSWTELDIWHYVKQEDIPIVSLYLAQNGLRYRSLGEKNITFPVPSTASTLDEVIQELIMTKRSEREGRKMDNETEEAFEQLRRQGYM